MRDYAALSSAWHSAPRRVTVKTSESGPVSRRRDGDSADLAPTTRPSRLARWQFRAALYYLLRGISPISYTFGDLLRDPPVDALLDDAHTSARDQLDDARSSEASEARDRRIQKEPHESGLSIPES